MYQSILRIQTKKYWQLAVLKISVLLSRLIWLFFHKIFFSASFPSQSLLVSKNGSKFWSNQTWQLFSTQTKHFEGECKGKNNRIEWTKEVEKDVDKSLILSEVSDAMNDFFISVGYEIQHLNLQKFDSREKRKKMNSVRTIAHSLLR